MNALEKSGRFPRSQREAGWQPGIWADDRDDSSSWPAAVGWAFVGAVILWAVLTIFMCPLP
jgi:hypothetical protein